MLYRQRSTCNLWLKRRVITRNGPVCHSFARLTARSTGRDQRRRRPYTDWRRCRRWGCASACCVVVVCHAAAPLPRVLGAGVAEEAAGLAAAAVVVCHRPQRQGGVVSGIPAAPGHGGWGRGRGQGRQGQGKAIASATALSQALFIESLSSAFDAHLSTPFTRSPVQPELSL